ncbi:MAG: type II toxin-antitoxin system Phd/YefM family antitoxin [Thermoleophilia bacterium]
MRTVGIRALQQNASAVVADAVAGETVIITDRGRPVAQITSLSAQGLQAMRNAGLTRPRRVLFSDLPDPPPIAPGRPMTEILDELREDRL